MAALSSPAQEGEKPNLGMNGTEESESAVTSQFVPGMTRGAAKPQSARASGSEAAAKAVKTAVN